MNKYTYKAYLFKLADDYKEVWVNLGSFSKLSRALLEAKTSCFERGKNEWDWRVEKQDYAGNIISIRSSYGGYEK